MNFETNCSKTYGLLWLTLELFRQQGNVDIDAERTERLRAMAPASDNDQQLLPVVIATLQSFNRMNGAFYVFRGWSQNEGRILENHEPLPALDQPSIHPWSQNSLWSYGIWTSTIPLINDFLIQSRLMSETDFLSRLSENFETAQGEAWVVRTIMFVLYFVYKSAWSWPFVFIKPLPRKKLHAQPD